MKEIKFAKESNEDISEKEIQEKFEKNLESLGDWELKYVSSFVNVGIGVIDILAIDSDNNPVIIECKKIGKNFDRDALIQLMRYYSWFIDSGNNILYLKNIISKMLPDIKEVGDNISLVAIVGDVEDDVKNACKALEPQIMLVTYSLIEGSGKEVILSPKIVLDTAIGREKLLKEPKTEEDHLKGHDNLKPIYEEFKKRVLEIDSKIRINPSPQYYIGFIARKKFIEVTFKKNWLRIGLPLEAEEANFDGYKETEGYVWGYLHIKSLEEINEELMGVIKKAYNKSS